MDFADIAKTVAKYGAPLLGGMLAGPAGAAAASALAAKFGADPEMPEDIIGKIESDPQATEKLIELQKIELQKTQAYLADNADARGREIELAKAGHVDDTPKKIALIYTYGYLLAMLISTVSKIFKPEINLDTFVAALSAGQMFILGYYFGSAHKRSSAQLQT